MELIIKKATNLTDMIQVFRLDGLKGEAFDRFYYKDTIANRTGDINNSPVEDLLEHCQIPSSRNAHLFMGHKGCGKSTELYQFKRKLQETGQPSSIVDVAVSTDVWNITHWDIMLLITEGLCQIALDADIDIPSKLTQNILDYLNKDIVEEETFTDSTSVSAQAGARVKALTLFFAEFKAKFKANSETRKVTSEKMQKRAAEWISYIIEITNHITAGLDGKQPVLIFENLDKLPDPEKAIHILENPFLSELPFPIVYTFPISLSYHVRFPSLSHNYGSCILPMIKVNNLDNSENPEGIHILQALVTLRAEETLFANDVLVHLIKQTGGVLRDLFKCIVWAASRARRRIATQPVDANPPHHVEMEDAQVALAELRKDLSRQIRVDDYDMLIRLHKDEKYRLDIEDEEWLLNKLLASVVLEYSNGDRWHNLHPMVLDFLTRRDKL